MLYLRAVETLASLAGIVASDTLLVSTVNPGKMALIRYFEGDFATLVEAMKTGALEDIGGPVGCHEVEETVRRALDHPRSTEAAPQQRYA